MSTLSVPLTPELENFINNQIKIGKFENKASVVRRALRIMSEEEAINAVLEASREIKNGKGVLLRGNLKKFINK